MKKSILALAVAAIAATGVSANAESYDQTVANQGDEGGTIPLLYFGTTNAADNFATNSTTDSGNSITIGLRAMIAGGGSNYYDVTGPGGTYDVPAGTRPAPSTLASWDYVYSIDLGSSATVNNYSALLTITAPDGTTSTSFDPLQNSNNSYPGDNDETGGGAYEDGSSFGYYIQQNAESPSYALGEATSQNPTAVPTQVDTDVNELGTYTVTLDLYNNSDLTTPIVADTINVDVVPLPASAWSGLALLGGLAAFGGVKRLRRQTV